MNPYDRRAWAEVEEWKHPKNGWLNRIAQPSPIHSWKLTGPSVVSAVKSGAVSLMRRLISPPCQ